MPSFSSISLLYQRAGPPGWALYGSAQNLPSWRGGGGVAPCSTCAVSFLRASSPRRLAAWSRPRPVWSARRPAWKRLTPLQSAWPVAGSAWRRPGSAAARRRRAGRRHRWRRAPGRGADGGTVIRGRDSCLLSLNVRLPHYTEATHAVPHSRADRHVGLGDRVRRRAGRALGLPRPIRRGRARGEPSAARDRAAGAYRNRDRPPETAMSLARARGTGIVTMRTLTSGVFQRWLEQVAPGLVGS